MSNDYVSLTVSLSIHAWQNLVANAAEDLREPDDFFSWLAHCEARRRGYLPTIGDHTKGGRKDDHKSKPA